MVLVIRKRLDHPRIKNILIPSTFWVYPALPTGELIMRDQCLIPTPATNSTSRSWSPLDAVGWVHCWIWTRFPRQVARFRGATVRGRACWQEENYPCLEADFSTTPTTSINQELFTMTLKENRWATMWTSDHNLLIWNIAKLLLLPHLLLVMVDPDFHKFVQLIWNYLCAVGRDVGATIYSFHTANSHYTFPRWCGVNQHCNHYKTLHPDTLNTLDITDWVPDTLTSRQCCTWSRQRRPQETQRCWCHEILSRVCGWEARQEDCKKRRAKSEGTLREPTEEPATKRDESRVKSCEPDSSGMLCVVCEREDCWKLLLFLWWRDF